MDLMDETRFALSWPLSATLPTSVSVAENDRFRLERRSNAGDDDDCLSIMVAVIEVIGGSRFSSLGGLCRFGAAPLDRLAARSDADGNEGLGPPEPMPARGSMAKGWSGRRRSPRLMDPSSFSVPLSGVLPRLRTSADSADSSCSSSCEAGMTRLRLLMVAFFIVTGLCTPWSL